MAKPRGILFGARIDTGKMAEFYAYGNDEIISLMTFTRSENKIITYANESLENCFVFDIIPRPASLLVL